MKTAPANVSRSCSIVTTEANEVTAPIHNRMPVILSRETWSAWLGEAPAERADLLAMLKPCPTERMRAYPIGARVGNVKNDDAALLDKVAA